MVTTRWEYLAESNQETQPETVEVESRTRSDSIIRAPNRGIIRKFARRRSSWSPISSRQVIEPPKRRDGDGIQRGGEAGWWHGMADGHVGPTRLELLTGDGLKKDLKGEHGRKIGSLAGMHSSLQAHATKSLIESAANRLSVPSSSSLPRRNQ